MRRPRRDDIGRIGGLARFLPILLLLIGPLLECRPDETLARRATPPVTAASGGLRSMLARVPAEWPGMEYPGDAVVAFADLAAQYAAIGVERPASLTEDEAARVTRLPERGNRPRV